MGLRWILGIMLLLTGALSISNAVAEDGLSKAQGDAILEELKSIKQLLIKIEDQDSNKAAKRGGARPTEARVGTEGSYSMGSEDAPVTLVEFTDFQCPYCKRFHDIVLPELKEKYIESGKLRYVSRDLPLSMHKNARSAAMAGRCAGEQGKFWEFRDVMFVNARNLEQDSILGYAKDMGLEMTTFQTCVESNKYLQQVNKDASDARQAGFTGTPSFVLGKTDDAFVNGIAIIGAKSFAFMEEKIKIIISSE